MGLQFERASRRRSMKEERNELLKQIGISKRLFKEKMPKVVNNKDGTWEVSEKRNKGGKMSLKQQVVWLKELATATKELRNEVEEVRKQKEEIKKEA